MLMHIIHVYMHLPTVHVTFDARKIANSIKRDMFVKFPKWGLVQICSDCIVRRYRKLSIKIQ